MVSVGLGKMCRSNVKNVLTDEKCFGIPRTIQARVCGSKREQREYMIKSCVRFTLRNFTSWRIMSKRKSTDELNGSANTVGKKVATEEAVLKDVEDDTKVSADGRAPNVKICCWNVAGLRAWVKKDGVGHVKKEDPDILCLLETKVEEKEIPGEVTGLKKGGKIFGANGGYHMYLYPAEKKGYSGVALWSKVKPLNVKYGMGITEHDKEGRLITAEYEKYHLVTSYVPNSGKKLVNLDYRRTWNTALKKFLHDLNEKKPVIFCGDLNVAHTEIDLANPKNNTKNAGFTKEERDDFTELLADGYIDTYRFLNPDKTGVYTFWTYMMNCRAKNVGWRLDYFLVAKSLESSLCNSLIRSTVPGSDHCPIILTMAI